VEFVLALPIFFVKMFLIDLFKITQIEGTFGINAFMDAEESPILFGRQRMTAVRTCKAYWGSYELAINEGLSADLAQVLTASAVVVI
jgi:hypothetical protein